jgi:hypothetical protein
MKQMLCTLSNVQIQHNQQLLLTAFVESGSRHFVPFEHDIFQMTISQEDCDILLVNNPVASLLCM